MEKKTNYGVIITLVIASLLFIAAVSLTTEEPTPRAETLRPANQNAELLLKQEMEQAYVEGCNDNGLNEDFCECGFEHLYNSLGVDGFIRVAYEYQENGTFSEEMVRALTDCLYLYNE